MAKTLETEIGYVIEVSGDRVRVELTVDTTVPLGGCPSNSWA